VAVQVSYQVYLIAQTQLQGIKIVRPSLQELRLLNNLQKMIISFKSMSLNYIPHKAREKRNTISMRKMSYLMIWISTREI
jgi:hypothetical protein